MFETEPASTRHFYHFVLFCFTAFMVNLLVKRKLLTVKITCSH